MDNYDPFEGLSRAEELQVRENLRFGGKVPVADGELPDPFAIYKGFIEISGSRGLVARDNDNPEAFYVALRRKSNGEHFTKIFYADKLAQVYGGLLFLQLNEFPSKDISCIAANAEYKRRSKATGKRKVREGGPQNHDILGKGLEDAIKLAQIDAKPINDRTVIFGNETKSIEHWFAVDSRGFLTKVFRMNGNKVITPGLKGYSVLDDKGRFR